MATKEGEKKPAGINNFSSPGKKAIIQDKN
jgi:hypothetical protein